MGDEGLDGEQWPGPDLLDEAQHRVLKDERPGIGPDRGGARWRTAVVLQRTQGEREADGGQGLFRCPGAVGRGGHEQDPGVSHPESHIDLRGDDIIGTGRVEAGGRPQRPDVPLDPLLHVRLEQLERQPPVRECP